ncbi:MAG: dienelactone hydrolase family protein [Usitatibacter sp.]
MLARSRFAALLFMVLASPPLPSAAQDPGSKSIPARVEIHPIASLTISDEGFLKGDDSGKPVTVTGELRVAQGSGKLPVVVLIHGSSGIGPNIALWSRDLNAMGISTFALDGFTGRGLTTVGSDQSQLGRLNLILDAYRALDILAKHPRVDPQRIVLMGFSRGGQATLYASLKRFNDLWNKSGTRFAAYIPFYPDCMTSYQGELDLAGPVREFHGTPDDYNPVAPCKAYMERLRAAGQDAQLTEYPNAPHSFDNPIGALTPAVSRNSQTVRNCRIREEGAGNLVNTATKERFTYKDACVERDPHVGHDPQATEAARKAVSDYLKATFKLGG